MVLSSFASLLGMKAYAAQVTLAWDPDPAPNLKGYKLYYGTSSRGYTSSIDVGNSTTYLISDLSEGTKYYFAATAYDICGNESGFSNEIFYSPPVIPLPPPPTPSPTPDPTQSFLAYGEVAVGSSWQRITFPRTFQNPVVVAKPASYNDTDPAVVRIRNVDSTGFEIRIQEWDYLDGFHYQERLNYLVMDAGNYMLADGTKIEAGTLSTNSVRNFKTFYFKQPFNAAPVLLTSITTFNGSDTVTDRLQAIDTRRFQFRLQEQAANVRKHLKHPNETVSYIAWEPSQGIQDGWRFEVNRTPNEITDRFQAIPFGQSFGSLPAFLADIQSANDNDNAAALRWQNQDLFGVEVKIEEEQSKTRTTVHQPEVVGYMLFAPL